MVEDLDDPQVRAWAEAVERRFSAVSIVKTYRAKKLCGYEVWRHLGAVPENPRRKKARLWFGYRYWRSELGYNGAALDMARKAAKRLRSMNRRALAQWWQQHCKARRTRTRRLPDDYLLRQRASYRDLQQMSHVFTCV